MSILGTILILLLIAVLIGIFPILFILKQLIWLAIGIALLVVVIRMARGNDVS